MRIKILFVGDKVTVINPLRLMLLPVKEDWEMYFAVSEEEAFEVLGKFEIDMIVTDMQLPDFKGILILEQVKQTHPEIIRLVFSGVKDREMMLKATHHVHQFLSMPDDPVLLKRKIEKIYSLQAYLHNHKIAGIINNVKDLPGVPELYLKIEEEINKNSPSFKRIEELISKDIHMTVKILQLVNSAFFGLPVKIINPLQAINFLGLGTIKSLVLMVHLFGSDDPAHPLYRHINKLWEHSLKVAKFSKIMSVEETSEPKTMEETYIGGLLHDVGKIVLWQTDNYFTEIERLQNEYQITTTEAEYVLYQTSHAEIGAYLLGIWGLPESLVEIVCFHHHPSNSSPKVFGPLSMVHISDHILNQGILDQDYIEELKIGEKLSKWKEFFEKDRPQGQETEQGERPS